jgi:hypothetical protein
VLTSPSRNEACRRLFRWWIVLSSREVLAHQMLRGARACDPFKALFRVEPD